MALKGALIFHVDEALLHIVVDILALRKLVTYTDFSLRSLDLCGGYCI